MQKTLKGAIRDNIFNTILKTGVIRIRRKLIKNSIIILMLHGVMRANEDCEWVPLRDQLCPFVFEKTLSFLKRYLRFISLNDAVKMINGTIPLTPYAAVVTFDDGYKNQIKYALPILEKLKVPATIFVNPGHIESRKPFWFDRLDYALQHNIMGQKQEFNIAGENIVIDATSRDNLRISYKILRDTIKRKNINDMLMIEAFDCFSEKLERVGGKRLEDVFEFDDWTSILTWEDIGNVGSSIVSWGSHAVDHVRLHLIPTSEAEYQLNSSSSILSEKLGVSDLNFCYPDGGYNEKVIELVRRSGYTSAVTVDEGVNRLSADVMRLKRIPYPFTSSCPEVLCRVLGVI